MKAPSDKFDWFRRRTSTPSGGTGPSRGYGGKGMKKLLYLAVLPLGLTFAVASPPPK